MPNKQDLRDIKKKSTVKNRVKKYPFNPQPVISKSPKKINEPPNKINHISKSSVKTYRQKTQQKKEIQHLKN